MSGGGPTRRGARALPLLAVLAATASLSGCVAAVVPVIAAAGALGKSAVDARGGSVEANDVPAVASASKGEGSAVPSGAVAERLALTALPAPTAADRTPGADSPYVRLARYALAQRDERSAGGAVRSVVLAPGVSLASPRFTPCGDRPLAVLIDLDAEGAPLSVPLDPSRSTAELAGALAELRRADIGVLWLSDRPAGQSAAVREGLARAGYWGEGDRLLLPVGPNDRKQERRWAVARDRCVVALAGDRRGDMDELYDYLKTPEAAHLLDGLWNAGWFLAPPPLAQDKD